MNNKTKKWIRAGVETFIHGATSSIASNVAVSYVNPLAFSDWPSKLKLGAACFLANGGLRFVQWWSNNPLPPESDTAIPGAPSAGISMNPLAKVQTIGPNPPVEPPKP